jgi:Kef-type K+ transport system membrane component KefB
MIATSAAGAALAGRGLAHPGLAYAAIGHPPPALAGHELALFLLQIGVLLLLALVLGRLATRLRMPAIAGELCAGLVLGPSLFGHLAPAAAGWLFPASGEQFHLLDSAGQLGVLMLVGLTGMELDLALLRRRGATVLSVSVSGLVLPLGLGIAAGYLLPASLVPHGVHRGVVALFLGVALAVSAIPVIAKTLTDMKLIHRNIGQLTLAAGVVDDACGWVLLGIVSALAVANGVGGHAVRSIACLAGVVAIAATVGRPLVRALLAPAARLAEPGPALAAVTIMILLSAALTGALGLEPVFGAFVCGITIGATRVLHHFQLRSMHALVMSVLAPLFFAIAGLRMDLTTLRQLPVLITAAAILLIAVAGKFAGAFTGALLGRLSRWEATALGAGMNARGVIQIVVATAGLQLGVLTTQTYTIIILVAITTSLMAPPILRAAMARVERTAEEELREEAYAGLAPVAAPTAGRAGGATAGLDARGARRDP